MKAGVYNLTEGSILKNLLRLAFPLMGTSFLQMAYTLMAMSWVGRLGGGDDPSSIATKSEAAIGSIGMLMWLSASVAFLAMIGSEIAVGQSIGAKKIKRASVYASHATTLSIAMGIVWASILFIFAPAILTFFKLPADIMDEAIVFLRIITLSMPLQFMTYNFTGLYNGAGRSSVPFMNNGCGLVLNMILDPLLMFTFDMGLHGAAVGAAISQAFVFCLFYYQIRIGNRRILNGFSFLIKPRRIFMRRLFYLGTPVSVMNSLFAIVNMNLARAASIFGGHLGLMTQTTGGQIEGVTWTTAQGFSTALSAFVAQNYAAGKLERGKKAYIYTLRIMLTFGVLISLAFIFFGGNIFGLIVPHGDAIQSGAQYLMVMGVVQVFMMLELTTQGMFNGVGRTVPPAVINIIFNFLRIPLAYYLATKMGIMGVWWAIAISTICKGILMPLCFTWVYKGELKKNRG